MAKTILPFAFVTLLPAPLLIAGALNGGWPIGVALFYITVFVAGIDEFSTYIPQTQTVSKIQSDVLSVLLVAVHFILFFTVIWSLSGHGVSLLSLQGLALFWATGLYLGQVSNANAHELIHRSTRGLHYAGMWVYISVLFGHHTSAHRLVHHIYVATPNDPNTSRLDESFYHYFPRAWIGSFQAGLIAERKRRAHLHLRRKTPYPLYIGGAAGMLAISYMLAGSAGVIVHILLSLYIQMQLLLSDYVQHYGLTRRQRSDGRFEPATEAHSWNAPHWFSSLLMLNAPNHSDHHLNPGKYFPELASSPKAPILPYALPIMATLALWPRLWRKIMNPRVKFWCEEGGKNAFHSA